MILVSHNLPKPLPRTSIRTLCVIIDKLASDPAAANFSAFLRVVVDSFIAHGNPVESTQVVGVRLNSKTSSRTLAFAVKAEVRDHYLRYCRTGDFTFGALITSALASHYFSSPAQPVLESPVTATVASPAKGWRGVLQGLALNQTVEFTRKDLPVAIERSRLNAHQTAQAIRDSLPDFRITTRTTRSTLYVTRLS